MTGETKESIMKRITTAELRRWSEDEITETHERGFDAHPSMNRCIMLLERLEACEEQLAELCAGFVNGNCTETYINIAPLIKAIINGIEKGEFNDQTKLQIHTVVRDKYED